jgi:hypothetical protein
MVGIAYKDGQRIGEIISAAIESGELEIPDNGTMEILIDKFFTYEFTRSQKLLLLLGSPEASTTGNLACAAGGFVIGGVSIKNFLQTKNRVAQFFYCGSIVCSGTVVIAGGFKAFGNVYGFSHLAIAGDLFGGGCLFLGNNARKFGNYVEGKGAPDNLNPFRPRSFARRPKKVVGMGHKGMSFVASSDVPVSFQQIIIIGGTIFTIYCYGKLIISIYNYLHLKLLPKKDPSQVIHLSARFLTDSFKLREFKK